MRTTSNKKSKVKAAEINAKRSVLRKVKEEEEKKEEEEDDDEGWSVKSAQAQTQV